MFCMKYHHGIINNSIMKAEVWGLIAFYEIESSKKKNSTQCTLQIYMIKSVYISMVSIKK